MTVLENLLVGAFLRKDKGGIKEDLEEVVFRHFPRPKESFHLGQFQPFFSTTLFHRWQLSHLRRPTRDDDDDDDDCPLIMRQKNSMHSMLVAQGRGNLKKKIPPPQKKYNNKKTKEKKVIHAQHARGA